MMGDDGEKFGAWPTTFEHCWGRGDWMERFVTALEDNAAWLTTVRPSDWTDTHPPVGRVYLPTSSYTEMTQWALPPTDAREFEHALAVAKDTARPDAKFLRGGFWRNFQRRYREINDLHKQMLRTSTRVAAMPAGPLRDLATDHLYQGQSNDCYWHGLFGGIYIGHMRLASFEHLIAAEDLAAATNRATAPESGRLLDVDIDGVDEVFFESPGQVVTVKLDEGASIAEWNARGPRHALTSVMRRRPESYHETLIEAARSGRLQIEPDPPRDPTSGDHPNDAPSAVGVEKVGAHPETAAGGEHGAELDDRVESIHELVRAKEPGLQDRLFYDAYERRSALVHLFDARTTVGDLISAAAVERADVLDSAYELVELLPDRLVAVRDATALFGGMPQPIRVEKTFRLAGERRTPRLTLSVRLENRSERMLTARLAVEWNLMFLGGGGNPAAFYQVAGTRTSHDSEGASTATSRILSGNTDLGLLLTTDVAPPADAWWYPIETISNSETGFERSYQGSSLVLSWPVDLAPGEQVEVEVRQEIDASRDRAAEETVAAKAPRRRRNVRA